jgi:formimidoylglutamate deiminase
VRIEVADGRFHSVSAGVPRQPGDLKLGVVVPGMGNLHSHAFQRGMAGLAEVAGAEADSFWSWRVLMYRFLDRLDPDSLQAIAELAYMEMLEAGFTRVGEFHYLHHGKDGHAYAQSAEMSVRIIAAAQATGIGLTLLPVFYAHSDFGGAPAQDTQKRLVCNLDQYEALLGQAARHIATLEDGVLGIAPHSLRATTPAELAALPGLADGPVHIHIAEQLAEVQACLAWCGQRPVQWLLDHAPVDGRWCLVHATHAVHQEVLDIATRGAVVGLCPITEANLGDGLFPAGEFLAAGGHVGIGSDSNVLIDLAGELRLLEYGQRLRDRRRNVLTGGQGGSSGRFLFERAVSGGAQALGTAGALEPGCSADMVELDSGHPSLAQRSLDGRLDGWIFAAAGGAIRSVWRRGVQRVEDGRHHQRPAIMRAYAAALKSVLG